MTIYVEFDPFSGPPVRDGDINQQLEDISWTLAHGISPDNKWEYRYSNELVILAIRVAIIEGRFKHTDFKFVYQGAEMNISEDGDFDPWPNSFCVQSQLLSRRALLGGVAVRKARAGKFVG